MKLKQELGQVEERFTPNCDQLGQRVLRTLWSAAFRDLKQSGQQHQGRRRLKNEFLVLVRISRMAGCVYRLLRRYTSTSAYHI